MTTVRILIDPYSNGDISGFPYRQGQSITADYGDEVTITLAGEDSLSPSQVAYLERNDDVLSYSVRSN